MLSDYKSYIVLNIPGENTQEHSSLNYLNVCVGQEGIGGNYPMTFVQAGFCCDAYQKNTTVVVVIIIIQRNLVLFIRFRDSFSSSIELNTIIYLSQLEL